MGFNFSSVQSESLKNTIGDKLNFDGEVHTSLYDAASGALYVGGEFTRVNGVPAFGFGGMSTSDNTIGYSFVKVLGKSSANGVIYDATPDGSGGFYLVGNFININGVARNYAARVDQSGSVLSWNPNPNGIVYKILKDGTNLYLGGAFTTVGGTTRNYAAKVNDSTGALDSSWNPNSSGNILYILKDGTNIYLGGFFTTVGGTTRNNAAKVNDSTGGLDSSWNPNCNNSVRCIAKDGTNIYMVGSFSTVGGTTRYCAAKVNDSTGALDSSWNPNLGGGFGVGQDIVIDGTSLYLAGSFNTVGGATTRYNVVKVNNSNAAIDATFIPAQISGGRNQ